MKFTVPTKVANAQGDEFKTYVERAFVQIQEILNNGLTPTENQDGQLLQVSFTAADAEQGIPHALGRVPTLYYILGSSAAMSVYDGVSSNTSSVIYLRSSAIGSAKIFIF